MAIKKLNEPKSKQSIEILNFFARHGVKYIHLYRFVCVLRPPSPSSCYAAASDLKIKRIKSKDMLHVCICVCGVCIFPRLCFMRPLRDANVDVDVAAAFDLIYDI